MVFYFLLLLIALLTIIPLIFLSFSPNSSKKLNICAGPKSYPIIGCLISFSKNRHRLLDWYTEILSQSPSQTMVVTRFGAPRTIVTANPLNVEYILKSNFNNYPKGKPFTEILGDFLGLGIFNVDGDIWNLQRKFASHEFSARSLREFLVNTLENEVKGRLIPLLNSAVESNEILDFQEVLRRFTFDTICNVTLGVDPYCLDLSKPVPLIAQAFDKASELCARRGSAPIYAVWKIKKALNLGTEKMLNDAVQIVHDSVSEIIRAKKHKLNQISLCTTQDGLIPDQTLSNSDLLSRSIMAGYDDEMVRDMIISFLMAGRDTTSAALTWFFWLISKNPDVQKGILDELNSLKFGENLLKFEDLKEMKYMTACLNESMRLYPPVAWDSKHARNDDVLPDGTPIYKGNRLTYFQYGMGRMEEIWGNDWSEFKPDRWFDKSGLLKMVSPYKFPVFQAGPRVCLGKEMAFIQMKYVVASILGRFEVKPVGLDQPVFDPLMTAYMAGGFNVRVLSKSHINI